VLKRNLDLPERPRILVITLRRLGDVLLTTPLLHSIRRGFPASRLHVLVFRGSEGILAGNTDIDHVLTMAHRPSAAETIALIARIWRRYDLAVSTQPGDRPTIFALLAGRRRVGFLPPAGEPGMAWKRHVHHIGVRLPSDCHRITQLMRLADALGLDTSVPIVCPHAQTGDDTAPGKPYAVVHANPFYRYKRWTDAGWRGLMLALNARGLAIVATEGPDPAERAYLDDLWAKVDVPLTRMRLDWPSLAQLLRGAALYVGPDTSTTHLAAASGCPTVALYGPTSPRLIGPWPAAGLEQPWEPAGTIQHRGNVWIVQNPLPCLPCEKLGCEGHLDSRAQCLDELSVAQVLTAVDAALHSTEFVSLNPQVHLTEIHR
jgi:heptosyltransferase-3